MVRSLHHLPFQSFPSSSPSPSPPPPLLRFSSSFEAISPSCLPLLRPGRDAHGSNRTRFRKEGCGCDTWTRRLAPRYRDIASIASVTARRYVKEGYPSLSLSLSLSIADRYLGCAGAFLRSFCSTFARRSFFSRFFSSLSNRKIFFLVLFLYIMYTYIITRTFLVLFFLEGARGDFSNFA